MTCSVRAYNHSFAHAHKPTLAISHILEWIHMHCMLLLCAVLCKALLEDPQEHLATSNLQQPLAVRAVIRQILKFAAA